LIFPSIPKLLRAALERVRTEIYRRKLDEISDLLRSYVNFSRGFHRYLTAIRVEEGESTEMPAENAMFMAADGNYVRLLTGTAVHEIRETMSGMTSKLDPEQFARVHRSFIVNRAYVTGVLRKEGAAWLYFSVMESRFRLDQTIARKWTAMGATTG